MTNDEVAGEETGTQTDNGDTPPTQSNAGSRSNTALADRLSRGVEKFVERGIRIRRRLGQAATTSRIARVVPSWRPIATNLETGVRTSRLAGFLRRCRATVSNSRIVRWLTREPDPQVIVIDLRETYTVGPILAVLDRLIAILETPTRNARSIDLAERTASAVEDNLVPVASTILLGFVLVTLVDAWATADPLSIVALAIAGLAGLIGLTVDRSPTALEGSTVVDWLVAILTPPEDPSN